MHSHIVKDHEGTCPICGMALVKQETKQEKSLTLNVSGEMQQALALKTEKATFSELEKTIKTYGSVDFDETGLSHIHPRASGWIETLTVNSLGQHIKKGELLYEIYSPELLVAQEDFLSLLSAGGDNNELIERGKRRLQLLGLHDEIINKLEKTKSVKYRVPYYAQSSGIVSELNVRQGMYTQPSDNMMTIADMSRVWVIADVFENQIDWVETGQHARLDVPALDIYDLKAQLEFIYPTLDSKTIMATLN